jgi:hypothetical protein
MSDPFAELQNDVQDTTSIDGDEEPMNTDNSDAHTAVDNNDNLSLSEPVHAEVHPHTSGSELHDQDGKY